MNGSPGRSQVALITGASKGLGFALASALGRRGWRLVIDARSPDALHAAAAALRAAGADEVVALAGDVADPAHRDALVRAVAAHGGADVVVNNASTLGVTPLPPLRTYPLDALAAVFAVNVIGPVALAQALLPTLAARRGALVNITSDAAVEGYEGWGGYGASKAALEQVSRVLAAEEPDVRVYWVDPGDLRTQMHQDAFPGEDIGDRPLPEVAVPGLLRLLDERPPSGRYRAQQLAPDRTVSS